MTIEEISRNGDKKIIGNFGGNMNLFHPLILGMNTPSPVFYSKAVKEADAIPALLRARGWEARNRDWVCPALPLVCPESLT